MGIIAKINTPAEHIDVILNNNVSAPVLTVSDQVVKLTIDTTPKKVTTVVENRNKTITIAEMPIGAKGDPGVGVPAGGLEGQILTKISDNDFETEWKSSNNLNEEPLLLNDREILKSPTGFTENQLIDISYNPITKKILLIGNFQAYYMGTLLPELTSGWESPAIADVTPIGSYFLSYNGVSIGWSKTPWEFSHLQIAYLYYDTDGAYLFCIRETHGLMDWRAHEEFHQTIGTYKLSGGILQDYTPMSTVSMDRRPNTASTSIKDEDLISTNTAHSNKTYTMAYLQSNGTLKFDFSNPEIIKNISNMPYYNLFSNGVWSQAPISASQSTVYMSMWQFAMPIASDAGSLRYGYVWLQGQSSGTLSSQQSLTPQNLNLGNLAIIFSELVFINQVIIRYRSSPTNNWDIFSVSALTGNKAIQVASVSGAFLTSVSTDASLTGNGTVNNPLSVVGGGGSQDLTNFELELSRKAMGNSYMEYITDINDNITNVDYWSNSLKTTKFFSKIINWTDGLPTQIIITDEITNKSMTTNIAYSPEGGILSVTKEVI